MKKALLWSVVALMVLSSCQDEFIKNNNKTSEMIGYSVKTNTISDPLKVRASRSSGTTDVAIEQLSQSLGGKQLYLHTVTDMVVPMDIKAPKKQNKNTTAQSRGMEVTDASQIKEIGVTSVVWNGDSWEDATDKRRYMNDVEAESPNFQTNYYWPAAEENIRFFAYSPKTAGEIAESDDNATLTFDYTVPENVTAQHDLLVASSNEPGNKKAAADLHFGHALTAVQFKLADDITGVKVTAVRIKGVKYKGTYTYNYCGRNGVDGDSDTPDSDTGEWNVDDDVYDGSNGEGFEISGLEATSGIINDGVNTFMMMPQTLPANATIEVDVIDTEAATPQTETLIAIIGGNNKLWQKGTKVIYTVSFNSSSEEWIFEFLDEYGNVITQSNGNGGTFNWYGGLGNYTIRSYKKTTKLGNSTPDYEPAKWVVGEMVSVDFVEKEEGIGVTIPQGETDVNNFVPEGPYDYGVMPGTLTSEIHKQMCGEGDVPRVYRGTKDEPHDLSLYDNINGGWNEPVENPTGRNTANCYIVRAPGYYKFPVVYGNAITNNEDNPAAYRMGKANETKDFTAKWHTCSTVNGAVAYDEGTDKTFTAGILGAFYDHTGGQNNANTSVIKGPWIQDQGSEYEPNSARLIWQDAPGLVSNINLVKESDGRYYITFRVSPETICEGNAVIAVCNDDTTKDPLDNTIEPRIMWSWHIWVSNLNLAGTKPITNRRVLGNYAKGDTEASKWTREESTFDMLPAQIGFCSAEVKEYAASPGSLTFNQVDENGFIKNTYTISFNRSESQTVRANANAPVYQWGRKDPMLPFHYSSSEGAVINKYYYTNSRERKNTPQISAGTGAKAISLSIQEPEIFMRAANVVNDYINSRNWCAGNYINLWNANCDELPMFSYKLTVEADDFHNYYNKLVDLPVVKTVYDPCPPGWEVPRIDAFTGATFDGTTEKGFFTGTTTFSEKANVGSLILNSPVEFEISIFRKPMPSTNKRVGDDFEPSGPNDFNPELFWILALGLRDDGIFKNYASAGSCLTSGMMLIQWMNDNYDGGNGTSINYELNSSRFYFTDDGSLKPMSGSFPDKAFGIFPARTGRNPERTEVLTTGNIKPWEDGDNISIEF